MYAAALLSHSYFAVFHNPSACLHCRDEGTGADDAMAANAVWSVCMWSDGEKHQR